MGNPLGCVSRKEMNTLGVACHCVIFLQHAKQARARERNCTTCTKQNAQQQKNNNSTNLPFSGSKLWWVRHAKIVVKIQHHKLQLGNSPQAHKHTKEFWALLFVCVWVLCFPRPNKQKRAPSFLDSTPPTLVSHLPSPPITSISTQPANLPVEATLPTQLAKAKKQNQKQKNKNKTLSHVGGECEGRRARAAVQQPREAEKRSSHH